MIELTLAEVAEATDGRVVGDPAVVVAGVSIDSRAVSPGDLFVALPGERTDGHDHAPAAFAAGATGVLGSRVVDGPTVVVDDPVVGLSRLATDLLSRLPGLTTIGLTGSSGKTSTKDLLAQVLPTAGETVAPVGSFNNELGLPLTVLRCDPRTEFLVLEMGARGIGHVAHLCRIAPPRIGLVLNVGHAHVGEFGDQDAIARAKGELVEALPTDGVAVLNADDPRVIAMASRTSARVITFGEAPAADVRFTGITLDRLARPTFRLSTADESAEVTLAYSGEHMAGNAAAAAAVALAVGMSLSAVAEALSSARPASRWRMEVAETPEGVTVVNDAYNANPESMRAAMKALVAMADTGRTWAVLGEMLELGSGSTAEHDALGRLAVRMNVDRLVAVGEGARPIHLGAAHEGSWGEESAWVPDADAAIELLRAEVRPGDVVLVKASRGAGLEVVAAALLAPGEPAP